MKDLRKYKLDEWIDRLTPIINEIIETKKGNINKDFWLKMIKIKDETGSYDTGDFKEAQVDGWFTNFFLYTDNNHEVHPPFFQTTHLANEVLRVPFELLIAQNPDQKEEDMKKINCEFLAGFVGIKQDEKTGSFKPEIGWVVRKEEEDPIFKDKNLIQMIETY